MSTLTPTTVRATEVRYGDVIVIGGRRVSVLSASTALDQVYITLSEGGVWASLDVEASRTLEVLR